MNICYISRCLPVPGSRVAVVSRLGDAGCARLSVGLYWMSDQVEEGGRGQCWAGMYGLSHALHSLVIDDIKHSWAATARQLIIRKRIMYLHVSKEGGEGG